MSTHNKIEFRGSISPIMSAIRLGGDTMRLTFDVPLTERENAIGLLALTDQPLRFTIQVDNTPASERITRPDDKPVKQKKEPKGPHSEFWQQQFRKGFNNYPDLIEKLECAGDQVRLRLHDVFETDSLSKVSPEDWEQWLESEGLFSLITLSRQAQQHLAEVRQN